MEIKIVEYDHSYADKVADMWNKSGSNWGNDDTIKTGEEIKISESSSGNLKLYLALDGEEVVGYCSFSEYRMDEGASYLPLLNVRPDYHGKKIGKKLILKVIEDAIESEWPRFDLFTWSGNIKAVPLYKKCGFFWEKKNDSVHLMNFLPYVFKTEAVRDYFDVLDWYKDSKREIEIVPDGKEENGFEYYEYIFAKDDINLRMEFERKGRGLRLIETNDYLIKATIDKQSLVFDRDYKINYEIINKSGKELEITFKGENNKNINYNLNESVYVKDSLNVVGEFNVGRIEEPVNAWNTLPTVNTIITINGKEAVFKLGVEPKAPVDLTLQVPVITNRLDKVYECYLDIENGFDQVVDLSFTMPSNDNVEFLNNSFELTLEAKEKKSIPLQYKLSDYGLYDNEVNFKLNVNGKESIYDKKVSALFRGISGKYYGKVDRQYTIANGEYICYFDHLEKDILLKKHNGSEDSSIIVPVKIGIPYSLEFNRLEPHSVDFNIDNDLVEMKLNINSRDFLGLQLSIICKLSASGVLESYYIVENLGDKRSNLKITKSIFHQMNHTFLPYNNEILVIDGHDGRDMDYYDDKYLDENWIFRDTGNETGGIFWNNEDKAKFNHWAITVEEEIGKLENGESYTTNSMYVSIGHKDYKEFRQFALANDNVDDKKEVGIIDVLVNEGNPFFLDEYNVTVKNNRKSSFSGEFTVNGITKKVDKEPVTIKASLTDLKTELDLLERTMYSEFTLFKTSNKEVKTYKETIEGKVVYIADNGLIKIKSSPEFSDNLFSIEYDGEEWLESTFPTPKEKAWWNPWVGGINIRPTRVQDGVVLKENISTEFIEVKDNFDKLWTGIKTTLEFNKEEKYKGMTIENYYLLLPGTKVVLTTSNIIQNTNKYINGLQFDKSIALNVSDDRKKVKYVVNKDNQMTKYKCGDIQVALRVNGMLTTESERRSKMFIYNSNDNFVDAGSQSELNSAYIFDKLSIKDGANKYTANDFIIFSEDYLDKSKIKNLSNIKLK